MKIFLSLFLIFNKVQAQEDLKTQVSQALQDVIQRTDQATIYSAATLAMDQFLVQAQSLSLKSDFENVFCKELQSLSDRDLLLFIPQIETDLFSNLLCKNAMVERSTLFLENSKLKIQKFNRRISKGRAVPLLETLEIEEKLGPSLQKEIDPSSGPVFFHGDLEPGHFALTFDDGPHPTLTDKLLEILKAEDVQATFFMVGERIVRSSPVIQRMIDDNHSLGTHSYTHAQLPKLPFNQAIAEIEDTFRALYAVAGDKTFAFFRFPYGARSTALQAYVKESQRATFFWNVDTLDWQKRDPAVLFEYALAQTSAAKRGIILFHDVQPQTIAIMPEFLRAMKSRNYQMEVFRTSKKSSMPLP